VRGRGRRGSRGGVGIRGGGIVVGRDFGDRRGVGDGRGQVDRLEVVIEDGSLRLRFLSREELGKRLALIAHWRRRKTREMKSFDNHLSSKGGKPVG